MKTNLFNYKTKALLLTAYVILVVLLSQQIVAQSPDVLNYQAVIRNASGELMRNATIGMQISILQGTTDGTAVYTEERTLQTNNNGLVTVQIGAATQNSTKTSESNVSTVVNGDFSAIDWGNGPYFIKVETDPAGGSNYTITGISQLLSVPYALHAKTADSLTGTINETDPVFKTSVANGITAKDTANWNNRIDSSAIAKMGYVAGPHTVDTDTHIDSAGIAKLGFRAGDFSAFPSGSKPIIYGEVQDFLVGNYYYEAFPLEADSIGTTNTQIHHYLDEIRYAGSDGNWMESFGGDAYGNQIRDWSWGACAIFIKNTTNADINHTIGFIYSSHGSHNHASIAVNGKNIWSAPHSYDEIKKSTIEVTFPANATTVLILKSGIYNWTSWNGAWERMVVGFHSGSLNLPAGLEFDYQRYQEFIANQ